MCGLFRDITKHGWDETCDVTQQYVRCIINDQAGTLRATIVLFAGFTCIMRRRCQISYKQEYRRFTAQHTERYV